MKSILLKIELDGQGIVNFDDSSQRFLFNGTKFKDLFHAHDNVKYAKKVLYKDENGNLTDYKIKISSSCIRKAIFDKDLVGQNTNFVMNKEILYSQLGSPYFMLNGYMLTVQDGNSFKKKSPITLLSAIQTNGAKTKLETRTRSGKKMVKTDVNNDSDTSLFTEEDAGEMTYESKGIINLNELQFVSLDDYYDRWSFSSDDFDTFKKYMKMSLPTFNSEVKYFKIKDSVNSFPELGFKFSDADVDTLVKYFLKRLLETEIKRNSANARISSLKIKFVNDAIADTFKSEDGWIDIKTLQDVENLIIQPDEYYVETDTDLSVELRSKLIPEVKEPNKKKKTKKDDSTKTTSDRIEAPKLIDEE